MNKIAIAVTLVLISAHSFADPVPPAPPEPSRQSDPQVQALIEKLMSEIQDNIQWRAAALEARAQVKKLQDDIDKAKAPKK